MNEVFERLSDVFEELRSDAGEREYSIQTEEAKKADKELKKENREYEKFLSDLSTEQRNFLENYMDIVDHAHFQEQQRAYYQGIVDAVQILAGYEFSDLTVLRIEQGTRFVPDYEVVALAEFFHVSCEYLLGVRNEK